MTHALPATWQLHHRHGDAWHVSIALACVSIVLRGLPTGLCTGATLPTEIKARKSFVRGNMGVWQHHHHVPAAMATIHTSIHASCTHTYTHIYTHIYTHTYTHAAIIHTSILAIIMQTYIHAYIQVYDDHTYNHMAIIHAYIQSYNHTIIWQSYTHTYNHTIIQSYGNHTRKHAYTHTYKHSYTHTYNHTIIRHTAIIQLIMEFTLHCSGFEAYFASAGTKTHLKSQCEVQLHKNKNRERICRI